ncbi:Oidioi.mRNA.OKI2018_I69.chr2.g8035.t1.cds [Oikopleura dioica]|uniref:Oidioi.mRNA.OKI2018_I69.chr2.g8035.t1.cds n=1 Tax=Oikopleura dioica TaxID=34765 RepID=A0ABN7T805_OIKDI|nr:Oidioi.mRNA.OKI2018_I69.chr2.g8035.t1.cds [Oikopleura dioica]
MMQRKSHPYADIKAEKKAEELGEEMNTVVKISSRNQPDLDLMEYYNDWRAKEAQEVYQKSPSIRSAQSPTPSISASEKSTRSQAPEKVAPPPIRERRDSLSKSERVQRELEEAMNELKAARANPPTPPPVFEDELDFSSIPLPEPLVLDLSVDSGHVDSVADELVDERALATDVDLWSNQSNSPQHSPRPLKSILKRNPPTLESAAIEKFEIEVPEISFTDQSRTGTLQVDRVKSPKPPSPTPIPSNLPPKEPEMSVKTTPLKTTKRSQESADEVDRQLELLMKNLKTGTVTEGPQISSVGIDKLMSNLSEMKDESANTCARCGKSIVPEDGAQEAKQITIAGKNLHKSCFSCKVINPSP